jgi:hypothetical protein
LEIVRAQGSTCDLGEQGDDDGENSLKLDDDIGGDLKAVSWVER